jgi:uncharacterized membrane protein
MSKKLKAAFLVSLVLNVVLVGVLLGHQWGFRATVHRFDRETRREQRMEEVLEGLPPDAQARLRDKFRQLRSAAEPFFREMRQAQDAALKVLGADPFDPTALDHQEARILKLRTEMTSRMSDVIKTAIKDLTPEERRRFAEMLRRPGPSERG